MNKGICMKCLLSVYYYSHPSIHPCIFQLLIQVRVMRDWEANSRQYGPPLGCSAIPSQSTYINFHNWTAPKNLRNLRGKPLNTRENMQTPCTPTHTEQRHGLNILPWRYEVSVVHFQLFLDILYKSVYNQKKKLAFPVKYWHSSHFGGVPGVMSPSVCVSSLILSTETGWICKNDLHSRQLHWVHLWGIDVWLAWLPPCAETLVRLRHTPGTLPTLSRVWPGCAHPACSGHTHTPW